MICGVNQVRSSLAAVCDETRRLIQLPLTLFCCGTVFFSQSEKGQCIKIDPLKTFFRFCHKKAVSAFRRAENRDSLL